MARSTQFKDLLSHDLHDSFRNLKSLVHVTQIMTKPKFPNDTCCKYRILNVILKCKYRSCCDSNVSSISHCDRANTSHVRTWVGDPAGQLAGHSTASSAKLRKGLGYIKEYGHSSKSSKDSDRNYNKTSGWYFEKFDTHIQKIVNFKILSSITSESSYNFKKL